MTTCAQTAWFRRAFTVAAFFSLAAVTVPAQAPASFDAFLVALRAEALDRGISQATIDATLSTLTPEPVVVARDRSQPEQVQSLDDYVSRRTNAATIKRAREMAAKHRALLANVQKTYGIPPHVLVAVWGIESNFGQFTGTYSIIRSLTTLAYDARRPIFRDELFHALTIVDRKLVTAADLKGSWAGAMGQPQFMPSSYLQKAVDFDGDGRVDIWTSSADVFGSMGNYFNKGGWTTGERWGREVKMTKDVLATIEREVPMRADGCRAVREMSVARPLSAWTALGVTQPGGAPLPSAHIDASLVRGEARYFLAYRNYEALLDYNCSNAYAVAVGLLSDAVPATAR